MITLLYSRMIDSGALPAAGPKFYKEYVGLSTDGDKPDDDDLENGSVFDEMDTGKRWRYDIDSETWLDPTADANADDS